MRKIYSDKLRKIADLLDAGKYLEIDKYTFVSPSGDGWGIDSVCINFSEDEGNIIDIGDVLTTLQKEDKDNAIQEHLDAIERIKNS